MCINTAKSFQDTEYFDSPKYGATLIVSWLSCLYCDCNHPRYKFFFKFDFTIIVFLWNLEFNVGGIVPLANYEPHHHGIGAQLGIVDHQPRATR
jgi:hypothetical protein